MKYLCENLFLIVANSNVIGLYSFFKQKVIFEFCKFERDDSYLSIDCKAEYKYKNDQHIEAIDLALHLRSL